MTDTCQALYVSQCIYPQVFPRVGHVIIPILQICKLRPVRVKILGSQWWSHMRTQAAWPCVPQPPAPPAAFGADSVLATPLWWLSAEDIISQRHSASSFLLVVTDSSSVCK